MHVYYIVYVYIFLEVTLLKDKIFTLVVNSTLLIILRKWNVRIIDVEEVLVISGIMVELLHTDYTTSMSVSA